MPYGVLNSGTFNGIDLSNPVNRYAVASEGTNLSRFRQFNALNAMTLYDFRGDSSYDSMQVTLSRQTGRRLQYFVAYTLGRTEGTLGGEYSLIDPYDPDRTRGVLGEDRTHVLNISWNAFLPDGAKGAMDNALRPRAAERMAVVRYFLAGERHTLATELHRRRGQRRYRGDLLRHGGRRRPE